MSPPKPITIIGGGLAGLTLGIALRRHRLPVTVWESGHYPRHRVCGEFISGKGLDVLRRLNLLELLKEAGAVPAHHARFFLGPIEAPVRALAPPALCLSRFTLDRLLAEQFRAAGGDLRENARYPGHDKAEGVVRASGRRRPPARDEPRWFGLKVHARDVAPEADLEMHAFDHGYVGLCRLSEAVVNVCGLFRAGCDSGGHDGRAAAKELLLGPPGSALRRRLGSARLDEASFCSVAGLALEPQRAARQPGCHLGDALTMIPPVTGNGMSMAFEAAEIAVEPLRAYAQGESSWSSVHDTVARSCDAAFRQRLFWAAWLQRIVLSPAFHGRVGGSLSKLKPLWDLVFAVTR